ncbi:melanopsin-like [Symsagittifera roscoffensis]|uniref:melanopsin-like n=1 Tax=Symsagittifera roscoffensis TaxID=84072 RepID=UPI00307BAC64
MTNMMSRNFTSISFIDVDMSTGITLGEGVRSPEDSFLFKRFGAVLSSIITLGLFGNLLTIVILSNGRTHKSHNSLTMGLAYSDLMMVLGSQLPSCISAFRSKWSFFGKYGCTVSAAFGAFSGFSSILIMCFIAYNRYVSVYYPLDSMVNRYSKTRTAKMLGASWVIAAVLAALPFTYNGYTPTALPFCCVLGFANLNWISAAVLGNMYVFGFLGPLSSICWLYVKIFRKITQTTNELRRSKNHRNKRKTEIRTAITSLLCVVVFVVCWMPYAVVMVIGHLPIKRLSTDFEPVTIAIAAVFAKVSAACNPFIYGSLHVKKWSDYKKSLRSHSSSMLRSSHHRSSGRGFASRDNGRRRSTRPGLNLGAMHHQGAMVKN